MILELWGKEEERKHLKLIYWHNYLKYKIRKKSKIKNPLRPLSEIGKDPDKINTLNFPVPGRELKKRNRMNEEERKKGIWKQSFIELRNLPEIKPGKKKKFQRRKKELSKEEKRTFKRGKKFFFS